MLTGTKNSSVAGILLIGIISVGVIFAQGRYSKEVYFRNFETLSSATRGPSGEAFEPVFTEEALAGIYDTFTEEFTVSYKANRAKTGFRLFAKPETEVGVQFSELFGGNLNVIVKTYEPGSDTVVGEWTHLIQGPDQAATISDFASELGKELAPQKL